jgi:cytochrome c55X
MDRNRKMTRRNSRIGWTIGLGVILVTGSASGLAAEAGATPGESRRQELIHLLRQDCGACHGLRLSGGLGPALRPQDLRDKPAEGLSEVILRGRPGTPMPGWQAFLSEAEARWMVETLMNGLTDEREDR